MYFASPILKTRNAFSKRERNGASKATTKVLVDATINPVPVAHRADFHRKTDF
jgi:hypothetical protein